ncbi:MAG: hypothetical protein HYV41_05215 [Candidatus Magasanikbacteria bacterium]|nr:hypothetical protein [Candidatus Magasanikbacteria bacterium]
MLTLRQRIFSIIGISAGLLVAIVLGILYLSSSDEVTPQNNFDETPVVDSNNPQIIIVPQNDELVAKPQGSAEEIYVKNLSRLFVERMYTYSNQNNNGHIAELLVLATPGMQQWAETQGLEQSSNYTGLVTEVLGAEISSFNAELGEAVVAIEVQQKVLNENENGTLDETTTQKSADVNLKKMEGVWLVDGVWWQQ